MTDEQDYYEQRLCELLARMMADGDMTRAEALVVFEERRVAAAPPADL